MTPSERVVAKLKVQIDDSRAYIEAAMRRGESLQLVFHVDSSGTVGRVKLTITGRDIDNGGRAPLTSMRN